MQSTMQDLPLTITHMLRHGQEVMLNEAMNVVAARGFERAGDVVYSRLLNTVCVRRLRGALRSVRGSGPGSIPSLDTDISIAPHVNRTDHQQKQYRGQQSKLDKALAGLRAQNSAQQGHTIEFFTYRREGLTSPIQFRFHVHSTNTAFLIGSPPGSEE